MKKYSKIIIWITIATIFGKVLGVIKDALISYYYGATSLTDAFFLAMSIPTVILGMFTASTDSAIIPQYKRITEKQSREIADNHFSNIVNILSLICLTVCVFMFLFPSAFIKVFATGFESEAVKNANFFLRIFSSIGVLHMLYCFFCTYNAIYYENKARTVLAFSTNFIVVIVTLFFHDSRLIALSIAFLFSNIVCAFLPIIQANGLGYHHSYHINLQDPEFRTFCFLFFPIMGSALLNDIQQYIDKNLGSYYVGGISSLNYGIKLINIFDSVIVVGLSAVLLPKLAEYSARSEKGKYSETVSKVTKYLVMILLPLSIFIFMFSRELIQFLFGRGEFSENSVLIVSTISKTYAPLIVFMPLQSTLARFFHAIEETKLPFKLNAVSVCINTLLSVILMKTIGLHGVSLATSIATAFICLVYIVFVSKKIGWIKGTLKIKGIVGSLITCLICLFLCNAVKSVCTIVFLQIIVGGCIVIVFFGIGYLLYDRQAVFDMIELLFNRSEKRR